MREKRRCTYCASPAATRDHIPPKKLFARPWPSDLITVPCCNRCNVSASNDDELLIWAIICSANAVGHDADRARQQRFAQPSSPRRKRMVARLLAAATPVTAVRPNGVVVGRALGYQVDARRINRVLARIVRGLYSHDYGKGVPSDTVVLTCFEPPAAIDRDRVRKDIQEHGRSLAGGAFQYRLGPAEDEPNVTICQMQFFGGVIAQGRIETNAKGASDVVEQGDEADER